MRTRAVVSSIALAGFLAIVFGILHDRRLDSDFRSIQPQTPESTIIQALGTPSRTDATCTAYGTTQSTNCSHVLIYRSFFSFFTGRYWLIFIDVTGNVTATSKQASH